MDDLAALATGIDPHDEIERLEAQIEALADRIESCRKLILAARLATAGGGVVLVALLFGALRFDPAVMMAAVAALLGGIVLWGSNRSTAAEAADEIAKAEQRRAALIGALELRTVAAQPRLH